MPEPDTPSVLQRMVRRAPRAGGAAPPPDRAEVAGRALSRAVRRAGQPYEGLVPETASDTADWATTLSETAATLAEGGLLVALEGAEGARGLLHLGQGVLDAVIEVQTTGRVEATQGPPRRATRIDETLARDFIDLFLGALAAELDGAAGVDWVRRLRFGGPVEDRRQLPLLMPEAGYHRFEMQLDLGEGAKSGTMVLAVPLRPGDNRPAGGGGGQPAARSGGAAAWQEGFRQALATAPLAVEAVLARQSRTLAQIAALKPGDMIAFDVGDLARVTVEDGSGRVLFRARLGQQGGRRAVCVTAVPGAPPAGAPAGAAPDAPPTAAAEAPPPPAPREPELAGLPATGPPQDMPPPA